MLAQQLLEAPEYGDTLRYWSYLPSRLPVLCALHCAAHVIGTGAG
jgi:hypothetical protein